MNLPEKLRANQIWSIHRGDYALCDDGKWRHAGFHSYALFTKEQADKLRSVYERTNITVKLIDNTINVLI